MPGFTEDSLTGQDLTLLRGGYQRRIRDMLGFPTYLAGTVQYGNVFQNKDDISFDNGILTGSVYLGMDTLLGPVYVGYGRAETSDSAVYLSIGNRF